MIDCFNRKKASGMDGISSDIFLKTCNKLPRIVTAIYNQCLIRGTFSRRWKLPKIISIAKPGKGNSIDRSNYSPISLLNIGGKLLEEILIHKINHQGDSSSQAV